VVDWGDCIHVVVIFAPIFWKEQVSFGMVSFHNELGRTRDGFSNLHVTLPNLGKITENKWCVGFYEEHGNSEEDGGTGYRKLQ
jgi:hypothetical protein